MSGKKDENNKGTYDLKDAIKEIHLGTFPAVVGIENAIGEMIIAIRNISKKYKLDVYTIVNLVPKLTIAFLKGSEINQDCEWKM